MPLSPVMIRAVGDFLDDLATHRDVIQNYSNALAANISFQIVEMMLQELATFRGDVVDIKSRAGVVEYVRRLYGDATVDIAARLTAVQTAVETAGTAIRTLMPKDASGWVLGFQLSPDMTSTEQFVWRTVTPAQSATVRSNLNAIVTAIDALYADLSA